jgi:hypothetical protein
MVLQVVKDLNAAVLLQVMAKAKVTVIEVY